METTIGTRIQELIDYLDITYNKFRVECGISGQYMVNQYVTGELSPSQGTIEKILKRYPVRAEWLMIGKGEMWEKDYFESRYETLKHNGKTPPEKIKMLMLIFEKDMTHFGRTVGVSKKSLHDIISGKTKAISGRIRDRIISKYPYITDDFFE